MPSAFMAALISRPGCLGAERSIRPLKANPGDAKRPIGSLRNHEATIANAATLRQIATANVKANIMVPIACSDACRRKRDRLSATGACDSMADDERIMRSIFSCT